MNEKIIYSDKLNYIIEKSRGMQFPDKMLNFDFGKFIKMLKLSGFDLRLEKVIIELLKHEELEDGTVEFSTDWIHPKGYKPLLGLNNDVMKKDINNSAIYKHIHGHLSTQRTRKVVIKGDIHKSIILGRSCRGVGFASVKNSYVLKVDLDNHNYDLLDDTERNEREVLLHTIINDLIEDLGVQPIYLAQSLSHGYHIYFRVSDIWYSKPEYKVYFCKTYNYQQSDVEISISTKGFRIPGHWTYTPGTWDMELGFIPDDNRTDFIDRFLEGYNNPEFISQCYNYQLWFMGITHEEYQDILADDYPEEEIEFTETEIDSAPVIDPEPEKKHIKVYSKQKVIPFTRKLIRGGNVNIDEIAIEFPITAKKRNHNLYAIYCRTAHTDFETFARTVQKADDGTSISWTRKSAEQKDKELRRVWDSGQKRRIGKTKTAEKSITFISNASLVHKSYKAEYENPILIAHLLKVCDQGSVYAAVNAKHHKAMTIVLTELQGYLIYQATNKRVLSTQFTERTDLCKGFIIPRAWCEALEKHYKIPFHIYRALLKIRTYLALHLDPWKPIITKDGRYYQHFGISYCMQFAEGAYKDNTGAMASNFMGLIIRFIKSLYSSTDSSFSFKEDCSTYMWPNSSNIRQATEVNNVFQPPGYQ